jgi:hypothetical protein
MFRLLAILTVLGLLSGALMGCHAEGGVGTNSTSAISPVK